MKKQSNSFTHLIVWKKAHTLVMQIYKITASFPKEEMYGIISQMRRAAVSISSNIAEGYSRRGKKEKQQFFLMALGSLTELQNLLLISRDLVYMNKDEFKTLALLSVEVAKLINSYISQMRKNENYQFEVRKN